MVQRWSIHQKENDNFNVLGSLLGDHAIYDIESQCLSNKVNQEFQIAMIQQVSTCKDKQNIISHNSKRLVIAEQERKNYCVENSEKLSIGFSTLKVRPKQDQDYPKAGEVDKTSDGISKEAHSLSSVPAQNSIGKPE